MLIRTQIRNFPHCTSIRTRILLVGRQNSGRDSFYVLLEREGYDVLAANNGAEGLAICRRSIHPVDLLITDYEMPGMSGLELARECARLCFDLRVLYVLTVPPDEHLRADLQTRDRGCLARPFRGNDLLHKTKQLLMPDSVRQPSRQPLPLRGQRAFQRDRSPLPA